MTGAAAARDGGARSTIDGWAVRFFAAGEKVPSTVTAGLRGYQFRKDIAAFDHRRVRRIVIDMPMKTSLHRYFGVVQWSDGTDLEELDRRSRAGADLSEELGAGLFCNLNDVQCLVCNNNHLVAVADGGNPIVTLARRRAHAYSSTCPTCGNTSYIRYAELFGSA